MAGNRGTGSANAPTRRSGGVRAALVAALFALGGCAHVADTRRGDPPPGVADDIAIAELVGALAQALEPIETTVQIGRDDADPLVARLAAALLEAGFGVQRVTADQGAHFLVHARGVEPRDGGDTAFAWRVALGPVEASRDYTLTGAGEVETAGPIELSGSRATIDAAAIAPPGLRVAEPAHAAVRYVASLELDAPAPVISLVTPELVERVARDASARLGRRRAPAPSPQALNASQVEIANLFYADGSNFSSAFDTRERVERRILVFADDSLKLGDANKQLLDDFVEGSVRAEDVISLVGCSNGPTALEIGNEGLALGRAARVTEALTARGIARERIYDEGCWAPVSAGERFPGRGVVLELWRAPA